MTYINFFKNISKKKVFFLMMFFASSLLVFATVNAAPPTTQYAPGETLDPSCSPGDANCNVNPGRLPSITATSTATSTFSGGISSNAFIDAGYFIASSTSASSTFANGINLTAGCFSVGGTCLSSGSGSGTVNTGTAGYLAYYPSSDTTVDNAGALFWDNTNSRLGIGTSTPYATLSVAGDAVVDGLLRTSYIVSTSTATSTFAGGIGSSGLVAGTYFFGSSSATSTFTGGIATNLLNVTGSATSSFTNGINLAGGCFSVNGTCVGGAGGGSGTVNTGTAGYLAYYPSSDTTVDNAGALFWDNTNSRLGIGTSSPYAALSVVGEAVFRNFTATSTTATSTIAGGLDVGSGGLTYDYSSGETTISSLNLGAMNFSTDAGIVTWIDMPVTSASAISTVESYSALLDGTAVFTVYGESDGAGGVQNLRFGIGTSTPYATLSVAGDAVIDGLIRTSYIVSTSTATSTFAGGIGGSSLVAGTYFYGSSSATSTFTGGIATNLLNVTGSATSSFTNGINLAGGCFAVNGTCVTGSGGSGSGTVNTGTAGYLAYYPSSDTTVDNAGALFWDNTNSRLGIGTSSPYAALSVVGEAVFRNFTATSTTATSTVAGGLNVGSGNLIYDFSSGVTSINALEVGNMSFDSDAGIITWMDMPVTTASADNVVMSYAANIDGNSVLTVSALSDGLGGTDNRSVVVQGALCVRDTGTCGTAAGTIYATTAAISDIDLAENYTSLDNTLSAGELVTLDVTSSTTIKRANSTEKELLLGIISTAPGLLLGQEIQNGKPVALSGRVPVKVNDEGGEIAIGDRLTISNTDGIAMKATTTSRTVGIALEDFSGTTGTIEVFVKLEDYIPGSQLAVDALGNLGIGTTTPEYKLHVLGDVAATSFVNISTRTAKKNISYLTSEDYTSYLGKIRELNPAKYQYNIEDDSDPYHIGLIAEESPVEILTANGKGVDIYKFSTLLLGGMKAQQKQIDDLLARVSSLESGTVNGGITLAGVISGFESFGVKIKAGLTEIKNLAVENLTVGTKENPSGITLYDETTGEPYCLKIRDGVTTTKPGACVAVVDVVENTQNTNSGAENINTETENASNTDQSNTEIENNSNTTNDEQTNTIENPNDEPTTEVVATEEASVIENPVETVVENDNANETPVVNTNETETIALDPEPVALDPEPVVLEPEPTPAPESVPAPEPAPTENVAETPAVVPAPQVEVAE